MLLNHTHTQTHNNSFYEKNKNNKCLKIRMKKALMIIKMLQKYRKYNKAAVVIQYRYVYRKILFIFTYSRQWIFIVLKAFSSTTNIKKEKEKKNFTREILNIGLTIKAITTKKTLTQKKWRSKIENWTSRRQQQAKWNKYKFIYKILCENDSHEKFNEFCNLFMRLYF